MAAEQHARTSVNAADLFLTGCGPSNVLLWPRQCPDARSRATCKAKPKRNRRDQDRTKHDAILYADLCVMGLVSSAHLVCVVLWLACLVNPGACVLSRHNGTCCMTDDLLMFRGDKWSLEYEDAATD